MDMLIIFFILIRFSVAVDEIYNIDQYQSINLPMLTLRTLLLLIFSANYALSQDCPGNQVAFGGACFDSCPQNTVMSNRRGAFSCQECDLTSFFVISKDGSRCECALQTYYIPSWDQCAPCHYSCLTCSGPSNYECNTCQSSSEITFRRKINGNCVCSPGYVDNGVSLKCEKCHQDCQTCTGTTETDCINCAFGKQKNDVNQCVCSNSFVQDAFGNCTCPYPLSVAPDGTCRDPSTLCGFNQQTPSTIKIKNIAAAASGGTSTLCACKAGLVRIKGKCETCKTNYVYNDKKKKCQCDPRGFEHKGNCVICPTDQIFNRRTGECDCKKNTQKTENGNCISCPSKAVYSQGSCTCIFNYYTLPNGKCKKCTKKSDNPGCQENVHNIDKPKKLELSDL